MVEFIDKSVAERQENSTDDSSSGGSEPMQLKHAVNIPGYTILSKLGEREASTVWQAKQESLNRLVAIKILKKKYSSNKQEVDDFINEAKAVAKLKSPNIIQVYDIGSHKDTFYFVMEYIEGQTLNHLLKTERYLPQKKALAIAAAVANAMEEAWDKNKIVHCDIKPENIMLENDGGIKLANIGLAGIIKKHADPSTENDAFYGTPNYMPPELLDGAGEIDYHSDMYSLGATLYHMVTGQIPFAGKSFTDTVSAQKFEQLSSPSDLKPNVTIGCCQIITRLMMKQPRYRFKDWSVLYRDLVKILEGKIVVTKIAASAVSTIASPGKVSPPVKSDRPLSVASKTQGGNSKTRQKVLKKKYSKKQAPIWLRLPLELMILAWFGWLGYQLIWLPLNVSIPQVLKVGARVESSATLETSSPEVKKEPDSQPSYLRAPQRATRPAATPVAVLMPAESVIGNTPDVPVENNNDSSAVPLADIKNDIVGMLLKNNIAAAEALINNSYPNKNIPAEVRELSDLLSSQNIKGNAVANAFRNKIGEKTTIIYRGGSKNIIVKSVDGQTISADLRARSGTSKKLTPIKFKISQLDPQEQSRLIGEPNSPDIAVAKYLLHMNAGDYINARSLAGNCGPLSDACIAAVDAKIKMIME